MTRTASVSVVIPCYNNRQFLDDCFNSILSQCLDNNLIVEVLFSDNASSDSSYELALSYCELLNQRSNFQAKAYRQVSNLGSGRNINFLFRQAGGEIVHLLCADDFYSSPTSLRDMYNCAVSNSNADILIFDNNTRHRDGVHWNKIWHYEGNGVIPSDKAALYFYLYGCFTGGLSNLCLRGNVVSTYADSMNVDFVYYGDFFNLSSMAMSGHSLYLSRCETTHRRDHAFQDSKKLNRDSTLYFESIVVVNALSEYLFGVSPPLCCRIYTSVNIGFYWLGCLKSLLITGNPSALIRLFRQFNSRAFAPPCFFGVYAFFGFNWWPRYSLMSILESKILSLDCFSVSSRNSS